MARITKPEDVKIGQWYAFCCKKDLCEIKNADDVEMAQLQIEDCEHQGWKGAPGVWETKEEALAAIRDAEVE